MRNADYEKGYKEGRKDEALNTLKNLYTILGEMTETAHETSTIYACIRDIEKDFNVMSRLKKRK